MHKSNAKKARRSTAHVSTTPTDKDVCFVIMPFGGWLDDYYETIYSPAIQAAGLSPHRADDLYRPSTIVNDIWAYTNRAKLLLADLTGKNPNVFYELGLAHALAKPVILVAESMDDIPFDLRALRIIVYDKNHPRWGERLEDKVKTSIEEVLRSPQEAVLPAFLHVRESASTKAVTPREKEVIEIKQELELLRREIRRGALSAEHERIHRELAPEEARKRIEELWRRGIDDDIIVRRLRPLGPPEGWIRDFIAELDDKALLRSPVKPSEPIVSVGSEAPTVNPKAPVES